ncbi:MAG: M48 family metalloprotease [Oligoflexia bacterium]|nr:M48 family metalloprotease [Oligoflexia bacterium]
MKNFILCALTVALAGCSPQAKQLGASLLSQTGLVSESQANTAFSVGEKLSKAAGPLTEEQEYYLGRGVSAMILAQYPLYQNQAVTSYVNRVGNAVAAVSDRPETFSGYHFAILDTSEVNAISAPGGFVFVSRGFLRQIPDEDALAAVLAHEVGHVVKGHGVNAISKANLTEALTMVGKEAASSYGAPEVQALTAAFGDSVKDVFNTLIKNGYSRSQEYEADEYAVTLLGRVGYSQGSLVQMLEVLQSAGEQKGGWYDTHPSARKRISEVKDLDIALSTNTPGYETRTARYKKNVKL